jgi:hypothetical protein
MVQYVLPLPDKLLEWTNQEMPRLNDLTEVSNKLTVKVAAPHGWYITVLHTWVHMKT